MSQSDKPSVDGLTLAALTKAERALWLLREHNHLHFGHGHSTVAEAQAAWILVRERLAALAGPLEQPQWMEQPLEVVAETHARFVAAAAPQAEQPDSSYSVSPGPSDGLQTALPFPPGSTLALSLAIQALEAEPPTGREWPVNWPLVIYGLKGIKGAIEANGELNADQ